MLNKLKSATAATLQNSDTYLESLKKYIFCLDYNKIVVLKSVCKFYFGTRFKHLLKLFFKVFFFTLLQV